jgi:CRP-like cAMP-binding protein
VGRIPAEDFLDAIAGPHAHEVGELIAFVTERWISLVLRLARFLGQDLRARVAASLIEAARGFGVPDARGQVLSLRITQDALADLSAGSLRKVNAVLRRFEREGLIGKEGGRIVLRELDALEELALAT